VLRQGLPVYPVLYRRNDAPPPPLEELEEAAPAADNPGDAPAA